METDLDTRITKALVGIYGIGDGVPAPVEFEDSVVELLNAEFHLGDAKRQHPVDMLGQAPVRSGLERHGDAPYPCGFVFLTEFLEGKDIAPVLAAVFVHGADALPHEPFLILGFTCRHGAAHDNEFGFVYVVTQFLKLPKPRLHLNIGVVSELSRPQSRGLFTRVALRRFKERIFGTARAGKAYSVRAFMRRRHHRDRCNTGYGSGGFHLNECSQSLLLIILCRRKNLGISREGIECVFFADLRLQFLDIGGGIRV